MVDAQRIIDLVTAAYPHFGVNKRNQVSRLVFEIAKREGREVRKVLAEAPETAGHFDALKAYLLKRRYPTLSEAQRRQQVFPELDIRDELRVNLTPRFPQMKFFPKRFLVEESVQSIPWVQELPQRFPAIQFEIISSYKEYVREQSFSGHDYNARLDNFFIVRENYDFYKKCACSHKSVHCGYEVVNLGSGCAFDCAYCYLQDYLNSPGILQPANLEDFFTQFASYKENIRMGSGEITDSLIFDHLTGFSSRIVEFFKGHPGSSFEFKTKSDNVDNLLKVSPGDNIIVSWSMNPPEVITTVEHFTASLDERLAAAERCVAAGYKVAFHFDPMIYFVGWETAYRNLVEKIFNRIDSRRVAWLSLGTLRMTPALKKMMENRFPETRLLDEEFIVGHDGKFRYPFAVRTAMYGHMKDWLSQRAPGVYLYLCMEEKEACGTCEVAPIKPYRKVLG